MNDVAVVILAAGKGTRMKSDLAKVLHKVAGKAMVVHVVEASRALSPDHIHVVVGHQAESVKAEVSRFYPVHFALQNQLLGTGDAVKAALPGISSQIRHILVLCGDVPLIQGKTLVQLVASHKRAGACLSLLTVHKENPRGYGRIVTDAAGNLLAIREEADASETEKKIQQVNAGIYCFERSFLEAGIPRIRNSNRQAEYYLTDLIEIAVLDQGVIHRESATDPNQVMGVNTLDELALAEALHRAQNQ